MNTRCGYLVVGGQLEGETSPHLRFVVDVEVSGVIVVELDPSGVDRYGTRKVDCFKSENTHTHTEFCCT